MKINSNSLFEKWNTEGIAYCSFKSNEHLIDGLKGNTDIDILIRKADYKRAKKILFECDYCQVEPIDVGSYPNVDNWYGMDVETGKLIHIHLHFELMTGKPLFKDYCLPWGALFIKNAYLDSVTNLYCVEPNYEYVLLCVRVMVKQLKKPTTNNIPKDMIVELDYLRQKITVDSLRLAVKEMYGEREIEYISSSIMNIKELSDKEFVELYEYIKNILRSYQRVSEFSAFWQSYTNRINRVLCRRLNRRFGTTLPLKKRFIDRGTSIAFVGIDGSGKSTVSTIITKWLSSEFDTIKFYAGAGDGKKDFISSLLLRGYKAIKKSDTSKSSFTFVSDETKSKSLTVKQKIKGLCSSIAYNRILKSNIKALRKSVELVNSGMVCVMDRYPQNSMPYVHDGAKVRKYDTGKGLLHRFSEKEKVMLESIKDYPYDLLFRMIVTPEVSYERKPEESLESLKYKAESLHKVEFDVKRVVDIDASEPLEEVVLKVKREIWDTIVSK